MTPTEALALALPNWREFDYWRDRIENGSDQEMDLAQSVIDALPADAAIVTVETLIDALAGTNINERDRKAYRDIFRTQAEDAIRFLKEMDA